MPGFRAVVAVVPPDVVFQASNTTLAHHSSWTWRGEELPFVPYPLSTEALIAVMRSEKDYRQLHLDALSNAVAVEEAAIQVEDINGPVLLVSSKHDQYWPSAEMSQRVMHRLETNNFSYYSEHVILDQDHFVMNHPNFRSTVIKFLSTRVLGEKGVCGTDK